MQEDYIPDELINNPDFNPQDDDEIPYSPRSLDQLAHNYLGNESKRNHLGVKYSLGSTDYHGNLSPRVYELGSITTEETTLTFLYDLREDPRKLKTGLNHSFDRPVRGLIKGDLSHIILGPNDEEVGSIAYSFNENDPLLNYAFIIGQFLESNGIEGVREAIQLYEEKVTQKTKGIILMGENRNYRPLPQTAEDDYVKRILEKYLSNKRGNKNIQPKSNVVPSQKEPISPPPKNLVPEPQDTSLKKPISQQSKILIPKPQGPSQEEIDKMDELMRNSPWIK